MVVWWGGGRERRGVIVCNHPHGCWGGGEKGCYNLQPTLGWGGGEKERYSLHPPPHVVVGGGGGEGALLFATPTPCSCSSQKHSKLKSCNCKTIKVNKMLITRVSHAGNLGHLTWVRLQQYYPFLLVCVYFHVPKQYWYCCQCLGFLTCAQMLMRVTAQGGCLNTVRVCTGGLSEHCKSLQRGAVWTL